MARRAIRSVVDPRSNLANVTAIGNAIENIYEDVGVRAHHRAKGSSVSRGIRDRYIRSESLLRLTGFD